jgi:uncharacterized protein YegL
MKQRHKQKGLGLVEVALLLMMASLALVPIVQMLGKSGGQNGSSVVTLNRQRTRELVAANNIMERAMAGEILSFNVGSTNALYNSAGSNQFDLDEVPVSGQAGFVKYYPSQTTTYNYGDETQGVRLKYRWTLKDVSHERDVKDVPASGKCTSNFNVYDADTNGCWNLVTPKGNRIVLATLDVFDSNATSTSAPSYTFSTFLFAKGTVEATEVDRVGLGLILDVSGSMAWFKIPPDANTLYENNYETITSPFLKDRYHREGSLGDGLEAKHVKLFDDRYLDIVWAKPTDDTSTPYNETFMSPGVLGTKPCGEFLTENLNTSTDSGRGETNGINWFVLRKNKNDNTNYTHTYRYMCENLGKTTNYWNTEVVPRITRIEAARSAMLGFLVALEEDLDLIKNMEMGFVTFSDGSKVEVPLESAQMTEDPAQLNALRPRFKANRDKFVWINRFDAKYPKNSDKSKRRSIVASGGTNTRKGMESMVAELLKKTNLTQKFIILLTDGDPTTSYTNNTQAKNVAYAKEIFEKHGIKVYTIGFAGLSASGQKMLEDMAKESKGQFYYATNPDELRQIFVSISYTLRKELVLSRVDKYNGQLAAQLK